MNTKKSSTEKLNEIKQKYNNFHFIEICNNEKIHGRFNIKNERDFFTQAIIKDNLILYSLIEHENSEEKIDFIISSIANDYYENKIKNKTIMPDYTLTPLLKRIKDDFLEEIMLLIYRNNKDVEFCNLLGIDKDDMFNLSFYSVDSNYEFNIISDAMKNLNKKNLSAEINEQIYSIITSLIQSNKSLKEIIEDYNETIEEWEEEKKEQERINRILKEGVPKAIHNKANYYRNQYETLNTKADKERLLAQIISEIMQELQLPQDKKYPIQLNKNRVKDYIENPELFDMFYRDK